MESNFPYRRDFRLKSISRERDTTYMSMREIYGCYDCPSLLGTNLERERERERERNHRENSCELEILSLHFTNIAAR